MESHAVIDISHRQFYFLGDGSGLFMCVEYERRCLVLCIADVPDAVPK